TSGVTGTASCSSSATMASPVADYSITCTIGGLLSGNYSFTFFAPGTLHVTKAVLTVTADDKSRQYGDANPAFDATISGFKNGENADSLTTEPALATTATSSSHAAGNPYAIVASGAVDANYTISYVDGSLTVTPVALTITADDQTKAYGADLPALNVSYRGL